MSALDLSDPMHVAQRNKKLKAGVTDLRSTTQNIMRTPHGRYWIYNQLARSKMFVNPFSADPYKTAFGCGEMNIGQQLLADIMAVCPEMYHKMIEESNARSSNAATNPDTGTGPEGSGGDSGDTDGADPTGWNAPSGG